METPDHLIDTITKYAQSIDCCLEQGHFPPALLLMYCGIDHMAGLTLPVGTAVTRDTFLAWVSRYMDLTEMVPLTPDDLYGARCGMVHSYSATSTVRSARSLGYMNGAPDGRHTCYDPTVDPKLILVNAYRLVFHFLQGVMKQIHEWREHPARMLLAVSRGDSMFGCFPAPRA